MVEKCLGEQGLHAGAVNSQPHDWIGPLLKKDAS